MSNTKTPLCLPTLKTFNCRPTWVNRAGRIDRSTCVEVKASDLWRQIPRDRWLVFAAKPHKGTYLLATTTYEVNACQLADLHDNQPPFTLQGDLRTGKSNALRNPRTKSVGFSSSLKSHASHLRANPNKGQSRIKMLGLPTDWSQTLTIQRWHLHAQLAQHFFACPHCGQRALKLFLPMCTREELSDALVARLWLDANAPRIARSATLRPEASHLTVRYGPLFAPRGLLCRKCLGLRYGEVKKR